MSIEHAESAADHSDAAIHQTQESTVRKLEVCLGKVMRFGLDVGRGGLNLGAYAAGGVIGTVQEARNAYRSGLSRKNYPNTKH